jgi:phenylalanyl-tRNA synthetase beta chain
MKLPIEWLREYVQTSLSDDELADKLTMAGLEVEETTPSEDGPVYHTKVTPNRGDWLSVLGTAREAAAALDIPLQQALSPLPEEKDDTPRWAGVKVTHPDLCPRYCGKIIRNITLRQSPEWMQRRLTAAGMRAINVVVDITNYVMLEYGQPLHAFDYDTLPDGQIIVRPAQAGEALRTLDGVERELTPDMLAICDKDHPIALAGIMGGAETEVTAKTKHLFLESAHFDPSTIRRTAKTLNLTTEASYRFERFVDPEMAPIALERAAELLADLADGEVVLGRIDLSPHPFARTQIPMRPERVNALLGTQLDKETISHSLARLGITVQATEPAWKVIVPPYRPDLTQEIDLVEEVGRMVGYETLPATLPSGSLSGEDAPEGRFAQTVRNLLTGLGLQEVLSHSLAAPSAFDDPVERQERVQIRLALSAELSGLRQSLVPNLLTVLAHNLRYGRSDIQLFEIGKIFARGRTEGAYRESRQLAGAITGAVAPRAWDHASPEMTDFFTAKGLVETLAKALFLPHLTFRPALRPLMHPGRCAEVVVAQQVIGYVAEVDPDALSAHLDIPQSVGRVAIIALDADALLSLSMEKRVYHPLPRYPAVSRDINVVVESSVGYALLAETAAAAAAPELLEKVDLQTLYTGQPIPPGHKAVALRLTYRAADRTLTDAEVDSQMAAVESLLTVRAHAERR